MNPGTLAGANPARIGRYEILERIGKGAMGVVYSARDEVMDRVVAVKVMMTDLEGEPDTRTRFYREAQAAGRLLHPNIITIFDMGEDEGRIYIVMELLKGETLGDYLRRPSVPLEQKVGLMIQTCEGLGAAHAKGIVHRDIKPGNLFVLQDGTLKILDFGVARLASSTMTASGFIIGTPDYMSPEQARGAEIDQRSDIFSSGAVFYYMLTGRKPFGARDLPTVLRKVQSEPPPPLSEGEAPPALARVISRSLAKEPAHRQQSMTELVAELSRFKRHFEAETRQVAAAARERYDAIQAALKERVELEERLGLPVTVEPGSAAGLRHEYPAFVDRAPELLLVPFGREEATAIGGALSAEYDALQQGLEELRAAGSAMAMAERALVDGRPTDAMASLEGAAAALPDTPAVRDVRARSAAAFASYREQEARLDVLGAQARAAADAAKWQEVLAFCGEATGDVAARPEFAQLAGRAREAIEREARERDAARRRALDQASRALARRDFDAADREIEQARSLEADATETERLAREVAQAREAAAAEAALAKHAGEVISLARAEFHAGHRAEALSVLEQCLAEHPDAPGARRELDHLRAEVRRLEDIERRRTEAAAHTSRAGEALAAGEFAAALRHASAALAVQAGHEEAERVRSAAEAGLRAEAEERERKARAEEHLARARQLMDAGSLQKAAREARNALERQADCTEAAALLAAIERRQAEEEAARERAKAFQNEWRTARQLLRSGDLDAARSAAERGLVLKPGDRAVEALVQEIAAERERRERLQREKEDDTVATAAAPEADDTVNLAPAGAGARRLFDWIGARLKGLRRRRWTQREP